MAPVAFSSSNGTLSGNYTIDTPSSTVPYTDTILNSLFGVCALAVGIITIWQGQRAYKARQIVQRGDTSYEEDLADPVVDQELDDVSVGGQNPHRTVQTSANTNDRSPYLMGSSHIESSSPAASTLPPLSRDEDTDPGLTSRSVPSSTHQEFSPLLDSRSASGARPVLDQNEAGVV